MNDSEKFGNDGSENPGNPGSAGNEKLNEGNEQRLADIVGKPRRNAKKRCYLEACDNWAHTRGMCDGHAYSFKQYGDPLEVERRRLKGVAHPLCSLDGCEHVAAHLGKCKDHQDRRPKKKTGVAKRQKPICSYDGCDNTAYTHTRGLCYGHDEVLQKRVSGSYVPRTPGRPRKNSRATCKVEKCALKAHTNEGYCDTHLYRFRRYGDPLITRYNVGVGVVTKQGYRTVRAIGHPNAQRGGNILEHVLVMSSHLGRPLEPNENIHHKNGNRVDNRLENLELWSTKQPPGQRIEDKVQYAKEILSLYEPDALR